MAEWYESFEPTLAQWYESFEPTLARHQDDFVTALPQSRGSILKTIRDEIVTRHKSLEDPVVLPKALKKAIRHYYLQFLTDEEDIRAEQEILGDEQEQEPCGVSPEEREAAARPKDAGFYKKELTDWDVAQKLFKVEMDDYDKEEQSKLGVKHSIKYCTGHARDWFNDMSPAQRKEVEDAKAKWNNEGAPAESQAMYRKRNLKRVLDDFTQQIRRTMGCQIVMLVSHKKKSDQTLSVAVHESKPLNSKKPFTQSSRGCKEWTSDGFEKFAEWSKLEFYPEDESDEDDDTKEKLPELVLDKRGFAKLPSRAGINTKGQQELVRRIFHASYKVFTKSAKPVPWREVIANPSLYLDLDCLPKDFLLRDPSHLRASDVTKLWDHWEVRRANKHKLIIFLAGKLGDMSKESLENAVPYQGNQKKKEYKEIDDKDQDPTSGKLSAARTDRPAESKAASKPSASTLPTPRTTGPAGAKAASKPSASTRPTPRTTRPAEGDSSDDKSSDDESVAVAFAGRTTGPAARPSGTQEGAPASIHMKDRVRFLKSLSSHNGYLLLVEGIKDLEKETNSDEQKDWPNWATWSWEGSYLPGAVHSEHGTVQKFLETVTSAKITRFALGMRVTLGLGLLLRECKQAIEYEADEAPQNVPTYIGASTLGIEILGLIEDAVDTVRGRILRLVKGREGQHKRDMIVEAASGDNATHSARSSAVGEKRTTEEVERSEVEETQKDQERTELEEKQMDQEVEAEQQVEEDVRKLDEAKKVGETLNEEKQKLVEEMQHLVEAKESLERQMLEVQHNDDDNANDEPEPEVSVEVKGKKRSKSGESGKPRKVAKTDDIRRSSRARLPSKKAMNT
ncbi:hypothetical protein F4604DRAFT_2037785 [Suillus subluteus]|nr:hypothetical protein F4604DRAFT_2037785 [Suillus subluteus]